MIHTGNMDNFLQIPIDPYGAVKSHLFLQTSFKAVLPNFRERQWTIL